MDKQVKSDLKKLNDGILPDSLNFGVKPSVSIDWEKVKYNSLYRDYSYYEKKFPDGYDSIAGFDKVIEAMAINALTPLEEINTIIENKSISNNNE
jgi:hypothetical protein